MAEGVHVASDLRVPTTSLFLAVPLAAAVATFVASVPSWRVAE